MKSLFILILGIFSLSTASILVKFCSDVPSVMIATYRLVISSIFLLFLFKFKGCSLKQIGKKELILSILSGFILSLHFLSWFASLKLTSVASSVVLVTTNPIFVGIFSYFFTKEKQNKELIFGIILSFTGSVILSLGDSGASFGNIDSKALAGDMLALLGAVSASCYLIIGSKVREKLDILPYITISYGSSAIFLVLFSLISATPFTGYSSSSYLSMIALAVFPQMIGHTSINWALKHLKTSMVAITILGEPIGATIMAYFIFAEKIDLFQAIGILLIFTSIIIASRKGGKGE